MQTSNWSSPRIWIGLTSCTTWLNTSPPIVASRPPKWSRNNPPPIFIPTKISQMIQVDLFKIYLFYPLFLFSLFFIFFIRYFIIILFSLTSENLIDNLEIM